MNRKIKNKDLAAKLGVSGTLVSLVLNNKADQHGIKKDTQERVIALARQMGYYAPVVEKLDISQVDEKPGVIGMIVPSVDDHFITGITPYLQKAFASLGYGFSIIMKDANDQRFERLTGAFRKFFSGIVLAGNAADDLTIRSLRSSDYPFVLLESNPKNARFNTVSTDIAAGSGIIANHISNLGYKNVIILHNNNSARDDAKFINGLEDAINLIPDVSRPRISEINFTQNDHAPGSEKLDELLRPPFRADLIITMNSNSVYPLISLLRKKKIRVPQDIAVISMEEGPGFDLISPAVTCLRKPYGAMASKIANMLLAEIRNSGKSKFKRQVNLTPELVVGNSCGNLITA